MHGCVLPDFARISLHHEWIRYRALFSDLKFQILMLSRRITATVYSDTNIQTLERQVTGFRMYCGYQNLYTQHGQHW